MCPVRRFPHPRQPQSSAQLYRVLYSCQDDDMSLYRFLECDSLRQESITNDTVQRRSADWGGDASEWQVWSCSSVRSDCCNLGIHRHGRLPALDSEEDERLESLTIAASVQSSSRGSATSFIRCAFD